MMIAGFNGGIRQSERIVTIHNTRNMSRFDYYFLNKGLKTVLFSTIFYGPGYCLYNLKRFFLGGGGGVCFDKS